MTRAADSREQLMTFSKRILHFSVAASLAFLIALAGFAVRAAAAPMEQEEEWFLTYKGDVPIGFTYARVTPLFPAEAPAAEKPRAARGARVKPPEPVPPERIEIYSRIWVRLGFGKDTIDSSIVSREVLSGAYRLESLESEWTIGDVKVEMEASVEGQKLTYTITNKKTKTKKTIDYPYGCIDAGAVSLLLKELNIEEKERRKFCVVNATPQGVKMGKLIVKENAMKEKGSGGDLDIDVYRLKTTLDGVPIDYRIDTRGRVLEAIQPTLGFVQRRVERSVIPKIDDLPGWDIENTTADVSPQEIPEQELKSVRYAVMWAGVEADELALTAANQTVEKIKKRRGRWSAFVTVTDKWATPTVKAPEKPSRRKSKKKAPEKPKPPPAAAPPAESPYLKQTPALPPESAVPAAVEEAAHGAKTPMRKVEMIAEWIYRNILPDPRSWREATTPDEILAAGIGMNKHYATLFAAMARAAGAPTRICAGKSYSFGFFVDHFWNEVYIDGRWIPVDATVSPATAPQPVNVKLAHGATVEEVSRTLSRLQPRLDIHIVEAVSADGKRLQVKSGGK